MSPIIWHYPHLKFWMGGTRFVYTILSILKNKFGTNIVLITNGGNRSIISNYSDAGISVIRTGGLTTTSSFYWLFFPLFLTYDLISTVLHLRKYQNPILVATLYPSNLIMAISARLFKTNYYYYCFEPFPFIQNDAFINTFPNPKRQFLRLLSSLYGWTDRWATKQAKEVLTLNEITKKMIYQTYNVNAIVTLMGVDTKHFRSMHSKLFTQKLNVKRFIVHSTDYTAMKNTDLAIKTIHKLKKNFPNILMVVTSTRPNAPEKSKYINLINKLKLSNNVRFLDFIPYDDLPYLYSEAACYLSCSTDEMLGTTSSNLPVKEALACGTPAIRANITTEDVEDGISGYLVDPNNTTLVANKISYLLQHPEIARNMGLAGRKKIQKLYKWDTVVSKIFQTIT